MDDVDQSEEWLWVRMVFGETIGSELMWFDFHETLMTNGGSVFGRVPVLATCGETSYICKDGII